MAGDLDPANDTAAWDTLVYAPTAATGSLAYSGSLVVGQPITLTATFQDELGQPLIDGNFASIDIKTSVHDEVIDSLSASDFLYEVGSGMLVEELDAELRGASPGAILKFNATLPERFGDRAGEEVTFQVLVKEAKRKVLPEPTDDWVSEVSEFDTVEGLRTDIRDR